MKLIYSPDDNAWYWQRFSDWKISQLFDTAIEAEQAKSKNQLMWK